MILWGTQSICYAIILKIVIEVVAYSLVAAQNAVAADADERDKASARGQPLGLHCVGGRRMGADRQLARAWCSSRRCSSYLLANLLFLIFVTAELANGQARRLLPTGSALWLVLPIMCPACVSKPTACLNRRCDAVGVTRQTIIAIEKNKYSPS